MYVNRYLIGGFADNGYWSSTEFASDYVWHQHFNFGYQTSYTLKYNTYYVRPVRPF